MKIAVTGSTGFIGTNFLQEIVKDDKNEYICLVRKESSRDKIPQSDNITVKEITFNTEGLKEAFAGMDVVINMVGQMGGHNVSEEDFKKANCVLTQDIIDACISNKVKQLIHLSTPGVQGFGHRLCEETVPYAPRNLYEETKVDAEQRIIESLKNTEVHYTIIRPDYVYGPGDLRRVKMYKSIRDKKFVLTTSGKSYVHPTHVKDVAQGIIISINNPNAYNEIFNISAENDITVKDYLNTIAGFFNVKVVQINIGYGLSVFCAGILAFLFKLIKKEPFVNKNRIDFLAIDHSTSIRKAKRLLNYKPEYDFKKGFENTMEWYYENNIIEKEGGNN